MITPVARQRVRSNPPALANTLPAKPRIEIVHRPPEELRSAGVRLRRPNKRQQTHLERNLNRFGVLAPVLIEADGTILDGHAVVAAARVLGLREIPTVAIEHLTPNEIRAFRISLHKIQEMATWDVQALKTELAELIASDVELVTFTSFETPEIDSLLSQPEAKNRPDSDDRLPSPLSDAVSRLDDLWIVAGHALMCGSALDPQVVARLMREYRVRLVLSDPPYNVRIAGHVSKRAGAREFVAASGEMSPEAFTAFLRTAFQNASAYAHDGSLALYFMDWRHIEEMMAAGRAVYSELKNLIVWSKTNAGLGSLWRSQHELVFAWKLGTAQHVNNVELGRHGRWRSNVWCYPGANAFGRDRDIDLAGHFTPKTVALLHDAILDVTHRGDAVLDPFAGAGSTLVAAHRTHRIGFGIELDPLYVDTAVQRLEKLTGQKAQLAATGQSFAEVAAERAASATAVAR